MTALLKQGAPNLWEEMEEFFRTPTQNGTYSPAVEIAKNENGYRLVTHLPGFKRDEIIVTVENGFLTLSGKREKTADNDYQVVRSEFAVYHEFKRTLKIDAGAFNTEHIEATLNDGILEVILPLAEERKPRQIEVQVR